MSCGIYLFKNKLNNKVYVGQSKRLEERYREHKNSLLRGTHHNAHLQHAVNKYGFEILEYKVLITCEPNELDYFENLYIQILRATERDYGYNLMQSEPSVQFTDEIKEKIGLANRGKGGSKLTEDDVEDIKLALIAGSEEESLAKVYGVQRACISKIACLRNWVWVRPDLNTKLKERR